MFTGRKINGNEKILNKSLCLGVEPSLRAWQARVLTDILAKTCQGNSFLEYHERQRPFAVRTFSWMKNPDNGFAPGRALQNTIGRIKTRMGTLTILIFCRSPRSSVNFNAYNTVPEWASGDLKFWPSCDWNSGIKGKTVEKVRVELVTRAT